MARTKAHERKPPQPGNREIERRFLVRRLPDGLEQYGKQELRAAFFITGPHSFFRLRLQDGSHSLTYKSGRGIERTEIPIPIRRITFDALWNQTRPLDRSQKTRYSIPYRGKTFEINVYHGALEGFVNAEVELASAGESVELPDWIGPEITNNRKLTFNLPDPRQVLRIAARLLRS
jgi:CYTH domain-containing protein